MNCPSISLCAFNDLFPNGDAGRGWFEKVRWPNGPECPKCGSINHLAWLKTHRRWNGMGWRHQFSIPVGTLMHRTHWSLMIWAHAITVAASKGISYPMAWYLGHRGLGMMAEANPSLARVVERDKMDAPPWKRAKPTRDHDDSEPPSSQPKVA